jgi:hypothetical protein
MAPAFNALVIGQSNAANHGASPRRVADPRARVFAAGRFGPLNDPLLGGTGTGGSVWTRLAPLLLAGGAHDAVTFTLAAMGGAAIADLAPGGGANVAVIRAAAAARQAGLAFTHVLFHQGERDTLLGTGRSAYRASLEALIGQLRALGITAPIHICRASYRFGVISDDVRAAQAAVIDAAPDRLPGPDTDTLGAQWRADNTHFADPGLEKFAALWLEALSQGETMAEERVACTT